jgi:ubiquinone/menaquinone biosynthesis C-methylase UbiE
MFHGKRDLKKTYQNWVDHWKGIKSYDEAMSLAVGGDFDTIGKIECAILTHYGLKSTDYLIDVGCGSGRLAKPLAAYLMGRYLGIDLVPDLVEYARKVTARPDWRFEVIDHIEIPEAEGQADMVCFFSVFTHLLHEQSYWYLEEAKRVLKPDGRIVFSFLEFVESSHWQVFMNTVNEERSGGIHPLNVFLDRQSIGIWARYLGLKVVHLRGALDPIPPEKPLGQSICVLSFPQNDISGGGPSND